MLLENKNSPCPPSHSKRHSFKNRSPVLGFRQRHSQLKKAQEQLKIYCQAVLKKAFEGKLTKEWREKIAKTQDIASQLPTAE